MDGGFVEPKGDPGRGIPLASPSKCVGSMSPVSIKGIAIDFNCPMEGIQSPPKHEHFSIRGFVAEMRKKDIKVCFPFASDMSLPPISVPKFRWWKCKDCVPDILDQKSRMQMIKSNKSDADTSSFQNHEIINVSSSSDEDVQPKLRSLADIIKDDENLNPLAYLEASSDAAKTPQRKRTMFLEDEEEMVLPKASAKIFKGPIAELENNTCNDNDTITRVEISKSKSEEDNSWPMVFGSRLGGNGHQNKEQKQSSIDINYKSKGKRVEEGCHYSPYKPPSNKDDSRDCNNKILEKVTLDLSLNSYTSDTNLQKQESSGRHTGIPDLNKSFVEKIPMTEEGLQILTFPEMALHQNLDMFASSNKPADNNTVVAERGRASDDMPMDIVELLAKNQHERALINSTNLPGPKCFHSNNPFKEPSVYIHGTPYTFNFPYTLNFPPPKNCHSGQHKTVTFDLGLPSGSKDQASMGKNVQRTVAVGSMDAYSNDAIPAMQLLSLMDQRIVMDSSFKVEPPDNILARQLSPCNQHLRPVKSHNQNDQFFSPSLFFGQSNCTNGFPALLNGAGCSGCSSSCKSFLQDQVPPQKGIAKITDLVQPPRSNLELEVCTLNRNPADFSIPDARNEFTIGAKDLKPKKRNPPKVKSQLGNLEGSKKQRVRKDSSQKELSRK